MSNQQTSYTLWSPQDTVQDVAESLGIDNVPEDVLKALAMDVEYRILEIIEQAAKFKRHAKRNVLSTNDIAKSLTVLNVEPLYGYHNHQVLNGHSNQSSIGFTRCQVPGAPDRPVYFISGDEEADLEKLLQQPLPPIPRLPTFSAHWLAVEGVQPAIPQNPRLQEIRMAQPPAIRGAIVTALNDNSIHAEGDNGTGSGTGSTNNVLDGPDSSTIAGANNSINGLSNPNIQSSRPRVTSRVKPGSHSNTQLKPLVRHVLSRELQLYFDKVVEALTSSSSSPDSSHLRSAALTSLRTDSGLHQLVPYFIQFIAEQITHHLNDLDLLTSILEMIYSLLSNESIFLDPYIHSLMPSILTLLLAKKLGTPPNNLPKLTSNNNNNNNINNNINNNNNTDKSDVSSSSTKNENKDKDNDIEMKDTDTTTTNPQEDDLKGYLEKTNALRDFAASMLDYVLKKFPQIYKSLKPRVARTLLKTFLDLNHVFGTYYGCLRGIAVLGNETIRFFLGNLNNWSNLVLNDNKFTELEERYLIDCILDILVLLKCDLPMVYKGKEEEVTDEERTNLESRCGLTISKEVLKRDDKKELICAIFFGE
ncbi:hypothetical protein TBLA_0A01500 [Henningerozyma blattae CBS 6284]|uniref:TBP-associated factor 6 n=1 Tax=Henningerozyma blattae (strain ATCC 34711 / CBS 6284 / DSM 70876 / NBRC 10599 / NRRL Y-10934 / UCD 77-7) TaxID=1071380 RepID=I2GUZ7_HENB6|nr:hypothetical protein TBLA_0A01500 [Tetrapisispora blattae CBS 6284]CCH57949.1 hypothetical protein TBLA_0A01500 [Tetrapisispora blattae CBS 6284]